jgi:hypothetical protein
MEENIEQELSKLRERWKKEPENRKVIEIQGKLLRMALEACRRKNNSNETDLKDLVREVFLNDEK